MQDATKTKTEARYVKSPVMPVRSFITRVNCGLMRVGTKKKLEVFRDWFSLLPSFITHVNCGLMRASAFLNPTELAITTRAAEFHYPC